MATSESTNTVIDVLDQWYVEDIDAEPEVSSAKDKLEFKQECLKLILECLFDEVAAVDKIVKELGEKFCFLALVCVN